ncbi:hypothetical protein HGI30_14050 [Paenibacillus albicereus]|uniref:Uncharacterized protein n=1 Tax=Paenibacillus albicereus TaxID=2726185 RepID=A0A6H2GYU3_9BACL|nr:hypothetical protein [Paenibacillus albicereus]QJC52575.1 hypothetical protein HGI30_14050 [Paenibacillus albicereus]
MSQNNFIRDKKEFEEILFLVTKAFNSEQRLPNQIFKFPFQKTVVLDFDHAMSDLFWDELEQLTYVFGDSSVIMGVLDPHPVDYYYNEFSQYNWCIFQKGTTDDDYWNMLEKGPDESPADAILYNSEVVVWLSPSMKWAIWGERSYGICILGFNNEIGDYKSDSWFTMDRAINELVSLNFKKCTVPEEISTKLKKFYSNIK